MKLSTLVLTGIITAGLLAGCGSTDESNASDPVEEQKEAEQEALSGEKVPETEESESDSKLLTEVGQTKKDDIGTVELKKIKNVNETIDIAPLTVTIQGIKLLEITGVNPEYLGDLSYYSEKSQGELEDGFTYVQIVYTAENTADQNVEWYDLMNIVTDKGEQIDGQMKDIVVNDADMDSRFLGQGVKKEFIDGFILNDGDINTIKLIFGYTMDADSYEDITPEEQTVEYSF